MPVQIRKATQHMAMFSVEADAAQRMIDYSGSRVCRYLPGRAIVVLMLMHYIDGDLGQYYEFGHQCDGQPAGVERERTPRLGVGRRLHSPPAVDQEFTLEAGTKSRGYPKVMADFTFARAASSDSTLGRWASGPADGISPRPADSWSAPSPRRSGPASG